MDRHLTLGPEVLDGFHNAVSKVHLPVTIHGNARSKRMRFAHQPTREPEAVRRRVLRQWRQSGRNTGEYLLTTIAIVAAREHVTISRFLGFLHNHYRGNLFVELFLAQLQLG